MDQVSFVRADEKTSAGVNGTPYVTWLTCVMDDRKDDEGFFWGRGNNSVLIQAQRRGDDRWYNICRVACDSHWRDNSNWGRADYRETRNPDAWDDNSTEARTWGYPNGDCRVIDQGYWENYMGVLRVAWYLPVEWRDCWIRLRATGGWKDSDADKDGCKRVERISNWFSTNHVHRLGDIGWDTSGDHPKGYKRDVDGRIHFYYNISGAMNVPDNAAGGVWTTFYYNGYWNTSIGHPNQGNVGKSGEMSMMPKETVGLANYRDQYKIQLLKEWNHLYDMDKLVGAQLYSVKTDVKTIPGFPYPKDVRAVYDQKSRCVRLSWSGGNLGNEEGYWAVRRIVNGKAEWIQKKLSADRMTLEDALAPTESNVSYDVCWYQSDWTLTVIEDLTASSATISTKRYVPVNSPKVSSSDSRITLKWTTDGYPAGWGNKFIVYEKQNDGSWKQLDEITPTDNQTDFTYQLIDDDDKESRASDESLYNIAAYDACGPHDYRIDGVIGGKVLNTITFNKLAVGNGTKFLSTKATKGEHAGRVKLNWQVERLKQQAEDETYVVERREAETDAEWVELYRIQSGQTYMSYTDDSPQPGTYYEYRITCINKCADGVEVQTQTADVGFAMVTGTVSGRISYDAGGMAVNDVDVVLQKTSTDGSEAAQFYAMDFTSSKGKITSSYSSDTYAKKKLAEADFSMQMWICPKESRESKVFRINATQCCIGFDNDRHPVLTDNGTSYTFNEIQLPIDTYSHLAFSRDGQTMTALRVSSTDDGVPVVERQTLDIPKTLSVEGAKTFEVTDFVGYLDEFRFWSKAITEEQIMENYDHLLVGSEKGLETYWTFDEGLNTQFFDYSREKTVFHNHHGQIEYNVVPNGQMAAPGLKLKSKTDEDGNYIVSGVPFSGDGTTYSVIPMLGVHKFEPAKSTIFVSTNSLVHNNKDFNDASSFSVSGTVCYENTDYPVQGANLYVDGSICSKDGEVITTDYQGNFTIDVPIGDHFIQIKKGGHTFVNNGRYPSDPNGTGTRVTFEKPVSNLKFIDNTKVVVAGRVAGGSIEAAKPLGLGLGEANIGKAVIKLSAGTYHMNVKGETVSGGMELGTDTLFYASASENVNSKAYVDAGDDDKTKDIYIVTDSLTGEFAALLPPVEYKVESIIIPANNGDGGVKIDHTTLSTINASNAQIVQTDSVETGEKAGQTFDYCAKLVVPYYVEPKLIVTQRDAKAFGDKTYTYMDASGKEKQEVKLWEIKTSDEDAHDGEQEDETEPTYKFGYPIFTQNNQYTFDIEGYEEYVNKDNRDEIRTSRVPLQNSTVTINNEFAAGQVTNTDNGNIDAANLASNQLLLDSLGHAAYTFVTGFPNITDPFTRTLNITYTTGNTTKQWNQNGKFKAIVLGELPTGTNFVTSGPDRVLMVLRDPPGSNSSAYFEEGTTVTQTTSHEGSYVTNNEATTLTKFGLTTTTFAGIGAGVIVEASSVFDLTVGAEVNAEVTTNNTQTFTTTTTKRISTDDTEDYVGANGDVFIGSATNLLFGNARMVDLEKQTDGSFKIAKKDGITTGLKFGTGFNYTQNYVENTLLPNFELMRNALLQEPGTVSGTGNATEDPIYVSKVSKDNEKFGSDNDDKDVWGSQAASANALEGPSYQMILPNGYENARDSAGNKMVYQDKVRWYNQQIKLWKQLLADNEEAKLTAKKNSEKYLIENTSFSAGATIEKSVAATTVDEKTSETEYEVLAVVGGETGFSINQTTGLTVTLKTSQGTRQVSSTANTTENTATMGYTLKENGDDDALSVDIFNAPDGNGPIFLTRGGQTSCPYEDRYVTKYYKPGEEFSAATMQIEKPELTVENAFATDVPSGGVANFTLIMRNNSETNEDVWFQLAPVDESNERGARITIDGVPLGDGRVFLVSASKELRKQLQVSQTDQSILDYDDIKLVLRSQCQFDPTGVWPVIADTVAVTAKFVPSCSDIVLDVPTRVVNTQTGPKVTMTVKGYNRNFGTFRGFRIQYKGERDVNWSTAQTYVNADSLRKQPEYADAKVIEGASVPYTFDMTNSALYPDQTYLFRAQTICMLSREETNNESDEITVVKDMDRPRLLGNTSPANGILGADGEIALNFNEDIKASSLTRANNFVVNGKLNGYKVDHDVALMLGGVEAARTDAVIDLSYRSFTLNFWVKRTGSGQLLKHGSAATNFTLSVNGDGQLVANIGGTEVVSTKSLPENKWMFVQASYNYSEGQSHLTANAAYDDTDLSLLDIDVPDYDGKGIITLGGGMSGAIHELTLWDTERSWAEAQLSRNQTKTASTKNLIGYWHLNEGGGSSATDVARARNMTLVADNWYFSAPNKGVAFNGQDSRADLSIADCSPDKDESYAFELWFRGTKPEEGQTATLFSVSGDSLAATFDHNGSLSITSSGISRAAGTTNRLDGRWHHLAINVLTEGTLTALVDGETAVQFTPATPVSLQSDRIVLGAMRRLQSEGNYVYSDHFAGSIDEVRLWNAKLSSDVISSRRNTRLEGNEPGLVAYYPFETITTDAYGQANVVADCADRANTTGRKEAVLTNATVTDDAPGMKAAATLEKVNFDFTASERRVVINLLETDEALEGTTVNFTLRNVRDGNDNLSQPITWSAYIRRNQLTWEKSGHTLTMERGQSADFNVQISNMSGTPEAWVVTGLPSWISLDAESGQLPAMSTRSLKFHVPASTPIGRYDATVYLTGNRGIAEPLTIAVNVTGEKPNWSVNPHDFEETMTLIGELYFDGKAAEDEEDIVAAFDSAGNCIGLQHPIYNKRFDRYFTMMVIYSNSDLNGKEVFFRAWDASTGEIRSQVATSTPITVVRNALYGTITEPVSLMATNQLEQQVKLTKGWQWKSFYVEPETMNVSTVFGPVINQTKHVKDQQGNFASVADEGFVGSLHDLSVKSMYRVNMTDTATLCVAGMKVDPKQKTIGLTNGWTWMGYTPSFTTSPAYALAEAEPQNGDIIKGQLGFAYYQDYEWIGTLDVMEPGEGYMYMTASERDFTYPSVPEQRQRRAPQRISSYDNVWHFGEPNYYAYPNNMSVIAKVYKEGKELTGADVGCFIDSVNWAASREVREWYFIGITHQGNHIPMQIKVWNPEDGQVYESPTVLYYDDDAIVGSPKDPFIIEIGAPGQYVKLGSTGYATAYYGTQALTVPADVTASTYAVVDGALTVTKTYTEGDVIPQATGVVLKGTPNTTYWFAVSEEAGEMPPSNHLYGSDEATLTNVEGASKYYMLSLDRNNENVGFYWGADNGGAFTNAAHKAYLALFGTSNAKAFLLDDATTTGLSTFTTGDDAQVYTLSGVPVSGSNLPAGVYIKNGKKFVVKNNKKIANK